MVRHPHVVPFLGAVIHPPDRSARGRGGRGQGEGGGRGDEGQGAFWQVSQGRGGQGGGGAQGPEIVLGWRGGWPHHPYSHTGWPCIPVVLHPCCPAPLLTSTPVILHHC